VQQREPDNMMRRIRRYFEISIRDRYVRLPFIGAGHYGSFGWLWDWWSELKRIERAPRA
jgi:hypothetical protein